MKQVLTPEDINFLEEKITCASKGPWTMIDETGVETAWVSSFDGEPIALFDYHTGAQNKLDAEFVVAARNYIDILIKEVKTARKRILELIQLNNVEVQKRIDMQNELDELKKEC